jgi:hypothetical protein
VPVGDDIAGGATEVDGEGAHVSDAMPALQGFLQGGGKRFVRALDAMFAAAPCGPPRR